jgi:hypothetical protein
MCITVKAFRKQLAPSQRVAEKLDARNTGIVGGREKSMVYKNGRILSKTLRPVQLCKTKEYVEGDSFRACDL